MVPAAAPPRGFRGLAGAWALASPVICAASVAFGDAGPSQVLEVPVVSLSGVGPPSERAMPMAGLGLCCRPSAHGERVREVVFTYLMNGGRYLDTASFFGNSKWVGKGIKDAIGMGVRREDVFIATSILPEYFGYDMTWHTVRGMLWELDVEYLDLVMLAQPTALSSTDPKRCGGPRLCRELAWLSLVRCQKDYGWVRHLGVSNFGVRHLKEILALNRSFLAVNQVEFHPWAPRTHRDTVEWCRERGIHVRAYAILGSPYSYWTLRTRPGIEDLSNETIDGIGRVVNGTGRNWRSVMLRWVAQQNISVLWGTGKLEHMIENSDIFNWSLPDSAMDFFDSLPEHKRGTAYAHFVHDAEPDGVDPSRIDLWRLADQYPLWAMSQPRQTPRFAATNLPWLPSVRVLGAVGIALAVSVVVLLGAYFYVRSVVLVHLERLGMGARVHLVSDST